tara:strand:+ start:36628 stop:39936 length:3309 start_codon:yes stop_codon:yes gene_type:complete
LTAIVATLAGCDNNGSKKSNVKVPDGIFFDAPVEGLGYTSSSVLTVPDGDGPDREISRVPTKVALSKDGSVIVLKDSGTNSLLVSDDSGKNWSAKTASFDIAGIFVSNDGSTVIASDADNTGLISRDRGVSWSSLENFSCGKNPKVVGSADGRILYSAAFSYTARSGESGVVGTCYRKSLDGGVSWSETLVPTTDYIGSPNGVFGSPDGQTVAIATGAAKLGGVNPAALYVSVDAGVTWKQLRAGANQSYIDVKMSDNGQIIFTTTYTATYISRDGGSTWSDGLPNEAGPLQLLSSTIAMSSDGRRLLLTLRDGESKISEDGGRSWMPVAEGVTSGLGGLSADGSTLVIAPQTGQTTVYGTRIGGPLPGHPLGLSLTADEIPLYQVRIEKSASMRFTDANGGFNCENDGSITFYLGNQALGTLACAGLVHVLQLDDPADEAGISRGLRIAQALQTLDRNRSSDGVVRKIKLWDLSQNKIDIDFTASEEKFTESLQKIYSELPDVNDKPFSMVTPDDAAAHIDDSLGSSEAGFAVPNIKLACGKNPCPPTLQAVQNKDTQQRVGGTVTGLPVGRKATLELAYTSLDGDKTAETFVLSANGVYKFASSAAPKQPYTVSLKKKPSDPGVTCEMTNASGTMPLGTVSDVDMTCSVATPLKMTLGGTISGLAPDQSVTLVTGNNAVLAIANGQFTFPRQVNAGQLYEVRVLSATPARLQCGVASGTGQVPVNYETSTITTVQITCEPLPSYVVSGSISGLPDGESLTVIARDSDRLQPVTLSAENGDFAFALPFTGDYSVSVSDLPLSHTCSVDGSEGEAEFPSVSVAIACEIAEGTSYSIKGTVSGLPSGETVTVSNTDSLAGTSFEVLNSNGNYSFEAAFTGNYSLALSPLGNGLVCSLSSVSGSPAYPSVISDVSCSGASVSGVITGLPDNASIQVDFGASLGNSIESVSGSSPSFKSKYLQPGTTYDVKVLSTSGGITCEPVVNGIGTMGSTGVTDLSISCASGSTGTAPGSLGGTVSGLLDGDIVAIQDSLGDAGFLDSAGNGSFTLPNGVAPGIDYFIEVIYAGPPESGGTCSVMSNAEGTMPAADANPNYVDNVVVNCSY